MFLSILLISYRDFGILIDLVVYLTEYLGKIDQSLQTGLRLFIVLNLFKRRTNCYSPGWILWHSSLQMNDLSFHESPDKSQISYFLLCNYINLFIPVAIPESDYSDRLFNHAQSLQLAGDSGQRPYYLTWVTVEWRVLVSGLGTSVQFSSNRYRYDQIGKHPLITFTCPCAGILKPSNAQGFYSCNAQELQAHIIFFYFFTLMRENGLIACAHWVSMSSPMSPQVLKLQ